LTKLRFSIFIHCRSSCRTTSHTSYTQSRVFLITQYSTNIPLEGGNNGTYIIMASMSETEIQWFREVTLQSSKLIIRLPRATSLIFGPYWYPEPFFIKRRKVEKIKFEEDQETCRCQSSWDDYWDLKVRLRDYYGKDLLRISY